MYYLMLILAVFGIVCSFGFGKIYQKNTPETLSSALIKNLAVSLVGVAVFLIIPLEESYTMTPLALISGGLIALSLSSATVILFFGYARGNIGIITMFQMAGGMLIPFVYGVLCGNRVTPANVIGIILMLMGSALSVVSQIREIRSSGRGISPIFLMLCLAIFAVNGANSMISYVYCNHPTQPDITPFLLSKSIAAVILSASVLILTKLIENKKSAPAKARVNASPSSHAKHLGLLLILAGLDAAAFLLQTLATPHLPAVVIYPLVTGGTLVLTALTGRFIFGERSDRLSNIGVIVSAMATFLFLF